MTSSKNASPEISFLSVPWQEMKREFYRILCQAGFTRKNAAVCAALFTENSLEGVYSHGVNRFKRFIESVQNGYVVPAAEPQIISSAGAMERWDGNLGPGPLNAIYATKRAMQLASEHGIGCVALGHTNHWMRGGYYGRLAAKAGYAFIGWSNTIANMPAWGARDCRIGNNPLVMAVPREAAPVVLDMAMSQYAYGSLEQHMLAGKLLSVPGGYDQAGCLSRNPAHVIASNRSLPAGYWKGSSLALLLDFLAVFLSGGSTTAQITRQGVEFGLSQIFIVFNIHSLGDTLPIQNAIEQAISDYLLAQPVSSRETIRLPGSQAVACRLDHHKNGIPVHPDVWAEIKGMDRRT